MFTSLNHDKECQDEHEKYDKECSDTQVSHDKWFKGIIQLYYRGQKNGVQLKNKYKH